MEDGVQRLLSFMMDSRRSAAHRSCSLREFFKQPIEEGRMPERGCAELTMLGAAGFAVVDDGRHAAGLDQAVFELLDLLDRHKVIVFACEDEHITPYALRHVLKRISAQGFSGFEQTARSHDPPAILQRPSQARRKRGLDFCNGIQHGTQPVPAEPESYRRYR